MKLNEILLIGGALVAALVLSKGRGLSSTYSLPQITNPINDIITQIKSEPIKEPTPLLENILPTPEPTPESIIIPTPEPIPQPAMINTNPLINRYLLARFPEWNTLLNPQVNLARVGADIVNTTRSIGNASTLPTIAQAYFRNETV
tara:strand:- start:622 stop:1059 length:438 start_codon:yes stop_codon:yes gene_type:complete